MIRELTDVPGRGGGGPLAETNAILREIKEILLSQGKGEEVVISENKVPERCTNCENDNHYSCTGCRCHADY